MHSLYNTSFTTEILTIHHSHLLKDYYARIYGITLNIDKCLDDTTKVLQDTIYSLLANHPPLKDWLLLTNIEGLFTDNLNIYWLATYTTTDGVVRNDYQVTTVTKKLLTTYILKDSYE